MKWLVFSDSHGSLDYIKQAIELEQPDKVLHLGDVIRDAEKISESYPNLEMTWVVGNCDGYSGDDRAPVERELFMGDRRVLMCHGHTYQVKLGIGALMSEGRARGADVVLFGHTHEPVCFQEGNMWVMNPGTARGFPNATYGVMELTDGKLSCQVKDAGTLNGAGKKKHWFF